MQFYCVPTTTTTTAESAAGLLSPRRACVTAWLACPLSIVYWGVPAALPRHQHCASHFLPHTEGVCGVCYSLPASLRMRVGGSRACCVAGCKCMQQCRVLAWPVLNTSPGGERELLRVVSCGSRQLTAAWCDVGHDGARRGSPAEHPCPCCCCWCAVMCLGRRGRSAQHASCVRLLAPAPHASPCHGQAPTASAARRQASGWQHGRPRGLTMRVRARVHVHVLMVSACVSHQRALPPCVPCRRRACGRCSDFGLGSGAIVLL